MRLKYTFLLVLLILSFGFSNGSGIDTALNVMKTVFEDETINSEPHKEIKLISDNGSGMNCSFQSRKSTVQNVGNRSLAVSVSSNWVCK